MSGDLDLTRELIDGFLAETPELLASIQDAESALAANAQDEQALTLLHEALLTVRRRAGFIDFDSLSEIARGLADAVAKVEAEELGFDRVAALLQRGRDLITAGIEQLRSYNTTPLVDGGLLRLLDAASGGATEPPRQLEARVVRNTAVPPQSPEALVAALDSDPADWIDDELLVSDSEDDLIEDDGSNEPAEPEPAAPQPALLSTDDSVAQKATAVPATARKEAPEPAASLSQQGDGTIHVDADRPVRFVTVAEELVLSRNRLLQLSEQLLEEYSDDELVSRLTEVTRSVGLLAGVLHQSMMVMRMLPAGFEITTGVQVSVADETFIIPLNSVIEAMKLSARDIGTVRGSKVILLRERVLPLIDLREAFRLSSDSRVADAEELYVVVVEQVERRVGILVDRLGGQVDVPVTALAEFVGPATGIAGATVLGDGRVRLVLDVEDLLSLLDSTGELGD